MEEQAESLALGPTGRTSHKVWFWGKRHAANLLSIAPRHKSLSR